MCASLSINHFSVDKLLGWGPANIYLLNAETLEKDVKYVLTLATNTVESCSPVFVVNIFTLFFSISIVDLLL